MSAEQWKPVIGYEGYYLVSDLGRVMRVKPATGAHVGRVLNPTRHSRGYMVVGLSKGKAQRNLFVHKLVMTAFVGDRPTDYEINHKDGDKSNNELNNLEYVTSRENKLHAFQLGLRTASRGELAGRAKLTWDRVREMRALFATGQYTKVALSAQFGIHQSAVSKIINGERWVDSSCDDCNR